jgi:hypothetical protein
MGKNLQSNKIQQSKKSGKNAFTKLINAIKKQYPNACDFETYMVSSAVRGMIFRKEKGEDLVTLKPNGL